MQKPMLIILIVCFTAALTNAAFAGGLYQSRYGFGTGNFKVPDPLGLNNQDPLGLGNNYKYKYKESRPEPQNKSLYKRYGEEPINNNSVKAYDIVGEFIGNFDNTGNISDSHGYVIGKFDKDGNIFNPVGQLQGRIDNDGVIYDLHGSSQGRIR